MDIFTLNDAQLASSFAVSRFALALLNWSSTPPRHSGLFAWRAPGEPEEIVGVEQHGPLLMVMFSRPMPLVEVLGAYPASEWAKVKRGGKHDPA